jgi:quercetin dioxygenase-like cupin family protein
MRSLVDASAARSPSPPPVREDRGVSDVGPNALASEPCSAAVQPLPAPEAARPPVALPVHADLPQQIDALLADPLFQQRGHSARTLFDSPDLRVLLVVLRGGRRVSEQAPGNRIVLEVLLGELLVKLDGGATKVPLGHLVAFEKGIAHEVEAVEDCAFLVSLGGLDLRR